MTKIVSHSFEEYLKLLESFHGNAAPGLIIGGFMVDLALKHLPEGILFDAVSETPACLPDAVQILTPCTVGNGWLKVMNLGRFALSLYDKYTGRGVRVFLDPEKLEAWPEIKTWLFKLKAKSEQDKDRLLAEIKEAGTEILGIQPVQVQSSLLKKKSRGRIANCSLCGEPYPVSDGGICRACQGEGPYVIQESREQNIDGPVLKVVALEDAVGKTALHDMTSILPGQSKGPAFLHGQRITIGDLCRLQQMGRQRIYVQEENPLQSEWVHENAAALAFAGAMAGEGIAFKAPPREGKINFFADRDGLFHVEEERLERFNTIPGVMCASQKGYNLVNQGRGLAGTRAIPLFLSRTIFEKALAILDDGPLFRVLPVREAKVGILVTGSEVFQGLVEDKFIPILTTKVEKFRCRVIRSLIAPDARDAIRDGVKEILASGVDLLVTTAGLSVDPDDVTRQGLIDAGATDLLYGAPILPGAMTLLARIGQVQVMGVPACALYFKITSFDLLFPRLLAGLTVTRQDLAKMGHGAFCMECKTCTFPKCPFGR